MAAAECVDAEPGEEVEVARASVVIEIAALAPDIVTVEPESPERPGELVIHVPLVQSEILPGSFRERAGYIEGHAAPCTAFLCTTSVSTASMCTTSMCSLPTA